MSFMTNESEDEMRSRDYMDSPLGDEGNCGGSHNGGVVLKKGPWTSAEDAILIDYVNKHGEGNWNAVQKHSGLFRCGKSCRLRWANHLRPHLKKGAFTIEEERLIIELHAKMGNKWARMAGQLPGRTDNEIKNYWNTRIKRRQRAGLPLYPPEVCMQAFQESRQNQNANGDHQRDTFLPPNSCDMHDLAFDGFKANQGILPYVPELPDISASSMIMKGLGSQFYGFVPPTMHRQKRFRESISLSSGFDGSLRNEPPQYDLSQDDSCDDKISGSSGLSFQYYPDSITKNVVLPFGLNNQGCHSLSNGNISASKPAPGALKLELPSFQYADADLSTWSLSPTPLLDSVDAFIQSPQLPPAPLHTDCHSPRNSGLLDALLYEATTRSTTVKNQFSDKSSNSSTATPSDVMEGSGMNLYNETKCEHSGDPISPLGNSAASIFSECTPISAGGSNNSLDENPPAETFPGSNVKTEPVDHGWPAGIEGGENKDDSPAQLDYSRPDVLLESYWSEQGGGVGGGIGVGHGEADQGGGNRGGEAIEAAAAVAAAALIGGGDDLGNNNYRSGTGAQVGGGGWGFGSCGWNNMPAVCQMSELP